MPKHLTTDDTTGFITTTILGAPSGIATLDSSGKVPAAQLPVTATGSVDSVNGQIGNVQLTAETVGAVSESSRGVANGIAVLDSAARLVPAQIPLTVLTTATLGTPSGIATLDSSGKLPAGQLSAPVASVNTKTGAVELTASDVGALAASLRGAASGVASLDGNSLVPRAQVPALTDLYQSVPGAAATKPGQQLTSVAAGSNSSTWVDPAVYTTPNSTMPIGAPVGALCVRTDIRMLYAYAGTPSPTWTALPYADPWRNLTLASGLRGYNSNDPSWMLQVRRVGPQVFIRGRVELTAGGNFSTTVPVNGIIATIPSDCLPSRPQDLSGTSTVATSQSGDARFQIDPLGASGTGAGKLVFYVGAGPTPATPWIGVQGSYWID